ncbi:flagellar hook-associated protein FlgK [Nitratiruptor sp. YY09-18]|uniref:flagellar hook-associated protein FlgK n=1 Tax=Nitratiruptor sp. YY09-18 TaxID=2724901 RepID=UPI0019158E00|nr:flagellar hook-associated protein FlgK [Nitratiruptor sp. YY09-18]BCD68361.1 flagellar hook-associated protein 1 FlgK [Nitratiruptor sp. YY09-18]
MSLFNLLNINSQSLNSFQKGIDLVNKNINNVNNKDYSKERAVFIELANYGVSLAEAYRIFDQRYFDRYIHENQKYSFYNEVASSLGTIESIFNDVQGSGFAEEFNKYYLAINDIINEPDNIPARNAFIERAKVLISKFQNSYESLENEKDNLHLAMQSEADTINNLTQNLALINKKIAGQPKNLIPEQEKLNSLLNERDKLIKELSKHIDVKVRYNPNQTADIFSAKGHALVLHDNSYKLSIDTTNSKDLGYDLKTFSAKISINGQELTGDFAKGRLSAKLQVEKRIDDTITKLNKLLHTFATENNNVNKNGYDLVGNQGKDIFASSDTTQQINLANIIVAIQNPEEIAAAKDAGDLPNDNSNIKDLYALKDKPITELDNKTFYNYYIKMVSDIANEKNRNEGLAQDTEQLVNALDDKLQEIGGVNLDEELVNLTQLQRSYQAAARVISVTDKLLETVMNIIR